MLYVCLCMARTKNPLQIFNEWYEAAQIDAPYDVNAMTLATSLNGQPSARMVLLRGFKAEKFIFFTNYKSLKGLSLAKNKKAALVFYWPHVGKQIRIEGTCKKVTARESDIYFSSRDKESQLSALASKQSTAIASYDDFLENVKQLELKYKNTHVPRPLHWGGYALIPTRIEFWEQRPHRRHLRHNYRKRGKNWVFEVLQP